MGQREGLSQGDLSKIRKMYQCSGNYETSSGSGSSGSETAGANKPTQTGSKPNLAGAIFTGLGNIVGALGKK
jgi:hypothetical protein